MRQAGEGRFIPLSESAQGYEVRKRLTLASARRITQRKSTPRGATRVSAGRSAGVEVWLESDDGLLGGFVDRIVPGKLGVELLDYKTGAITEREAGIVKPAYEAQLLLYAAIYHETCGEWPIRLTLTNLAGGNHQVPLDTARARNIMEQARTKLTAINNLIASGAPPQRLATPSPDACRFCGYRPVCKGYWSKREQSPGWPADAVGTVNSVTLLGNGTLLLALNIGARQVTVRGLSPTRFPFLMQDVSAAMLCDLRRDVVETSYRQTDLTTGFALEE